MDKKERMNAAFNYLRDHGYLHTQKDMADAIGSTAPNVSRMLKGDPKVLTDNICVRVQRSYGCISANWLMHGEGEMLVVEEPTEQGDANGTLAAKNETIATLKAQLKDKDALLADKDGRIADKQALIDNLQEQVADLRRQLATYRSKELMGDLPFKLGKVGEGDLPSAGE
jgi:plasmid maintenance system antidote protein VapI